MSKLWSGKRPRPRYLGGASLPGATERTAADIVANPGEKFEIGIDTGTGRDMIDRRFLRNFNHQIKKMVGNPIRGFNGPATSLEEYAVFTFFAEAKGRLVKMNGAAWVVDNLDANCLLGTGWLPYRRSAKRSARPRGCSGDRHRTA
jgi:hypothetical protein